MTLHILNSSSNYRSSPMETYSSMYRYYFVFYKWILPILKHQLSLIHPSSSIYYGDHILSKSASSRIESTDSIRSITDLHWLFRRSFTLNPLQYFQRANHVLYIASLKITLKCISMLFHWGLRAYQVHLQLLYLMILDVYFTPCCLCPILSASIRNR